ncbi:hypothetical protein [Methanomethylovorans hollandica]|nr:hypothetical protein [Methanomethylovorans hollandica]
MIMDVHFQASLFSGMNYSILSIIKVPYAMDHKIGLGGTFTMDTSLADGL